MVFVIKTKAQIMFLTIVFHIICYLNVYVQFNLVQETFYANNSLIQAKLKQFIQKKKKTLQQ